MELQHGDSAHLPYADCRFDKVYSLHTLYFWSAPAEHLREIHRVLKPDGLLAIGFAPGEDTLVRAHFPATVYRFYITDEVRGLLQEAGFSGLKMIRRDVSSRPIVFALAQRASAGGCASTFAKGAPRYAT